jgi:hypothetical protein
VRRCSTRAKIQWIGANALIHGVNGRFMTIILPIELSV